MQRRPFSRLHDWRILRRSVAVAAAGIGVALLTAPLAGAQGDDTEVVRGAANASADSMSFLILNGGASLGWTFGRSTAAYRDITNTAQGKSIDLGGLGALLSQPQCGGLFPPVLDTETLPPQTVAESFGSGPQGPIEAEVTYPQTVDDSSAAATLGTQRARSSDTDAESWTTTENQDFGFFRVVGARSRALTSFEGGVRRAHAEFMADRIDVLGGLVTFIEPTWTASTTSGNSQSEAGGFSFRSASVFGNWVSGAILERDLGIFETLVEGILGPLGVDVEFPEVRQPTSGDGISVSPMAINMEDAPLGNDLLIPLLDTDLLKQYRVDSVEEDCRRESFWTIIDALERALGGVGSIQTLIGGAEATTDSTDFSFEPLDFGGGAELEAPAPSAPEVSPPIEIPEDTGSGIDDFDTGFDDTGFDGSFDDTGFDDTDFDGSFDDTGFDDTGLDELSEEGTSFEEVGGEADLDEADGDDGEEISDSREIASGDDGGDAGGDVTAIVLGVLALLGAVALSLGDRVMGLRNQHTISDSDA